MILDALLITIGIMLGITAISVLAIAALIAIERITRTRLAWWLRTRWALHRARPTRTGR